MSSNFVSPGDNVELTAPTGGVTNAIGYFVGSLFLVAQRTVAAALAFVGLTRGVIALVKVSAQAWAEGDKIFWDVSQSKATNVFGANARFIGIAVAAAANPSATGKVRLNGGYSPLFPEVAAAAASHADAGAVTLTAAEILGRVVVADCSGAGRTYTLPTAALLVAAIPGVKVGDVVDCLLVNGSDAAETITVAAGAGGGFDANQTASSRVIPQNTSKLLRIRLTNVTAAAEAYVAYL
jgi:predicted RecA/RadA family phage recombinase